jgi:hypothetical protein
MTKMHCKTTTHYWFEYHEPDAKLGNADIYYHKDGVFVVAGDKHIFIKGE